MPQVSKNKLPEKYLEKIYDLFFEVFARSQTKDKFLILINDILTPTEKIMLAKRIGIIYLLIKNIDTRTISKVLKMSTSTIANYSHFFHNKNSHIVAVINKMLFKEKVLGFIEDIFADLFIQPGVKIGHHKLKWEHENRKQERRILG